MPLDRFEIDKSTDLTRGPAQDSSALTQFGQSFFTSAGREWAALGQVFGADVHLPMAPQSAETALARNSELESLPKKELMGAAVRNCFRK